MAVTDAMIEAAMGVLRANGITPGAVIREALIAGLEAGAVRPDLAPMLAALKEIIENQHRQIAQMGAAMTALIEQSAAQAAAAGQLRLIATAPSLEVEPSGVTNVQPDPSDVDWRPLSSVPVNPPIHEPRSSGSLPKTTSRQGPGEAQACRPATQETGSPEAAETDCPAAPADPGTVPPTRSRGGQ